MNSTIVLSRNEDQLPASQNPALVYLASLPAKSGQRTQAQALRTIAGILGSNNENILDIRWSALRYQHTALIRSKLMEFYAPASVNKMLSALRGVLKECWRLGQMNAEDYQRAIDLKRVTGTSLPAGRELSGAEILALMDVCQSDKSPAGTRDAAIIAILYMAGLRRDELVKLKFEDLTRNKLLVHGKRNKPRTAYVVNGALDALEDWLRIRGRREGALFCAINKGGQLRPGTLSAQTVYNILLKRGKEAGLEHFSPHDFRRTFISDLLDSGADIVTVGKMAGQSNVSTTAGYDRRGETAKEKAAELLHIPYRKEKP